MSTATVPTEETPATDRESRIVPRRRRRQVSFWYFWAWGVAVPAAREARRRRHGIRRPEQYSLYEVIPDATLAETPRGGPIRAAALHAYAPRKLRVGARPRSIGNKPLSEKEKAETRSILRQLRRAGIETERPKLYPDDCPTGPCPWVSCRYNLYLDVDDVSGAVKLTFPDKDVDEVPETCALRAAGGGPQTLEQIGRITNRTQEGVRKVQEEATARLARLVDGDPRRMRRALAVLAGGDRE